MKKAMKRAPDPPPQPREGMDADSLKAGILRHLEFTLGELPRHVDSDWEPYVSVALAVRDRLMERWIRTQDAYYEHDAKRVYYMSLEFLMGRTLGNSLINLGLLEPCQQALADLAYDFERIREAEWDAGLGNGGLGPARRLLPRLAGDPRAARPTATAFATTTGSSTSASWTAPRSRPPTAGCATATRGRSRGPATTSGSASAAASTSTWTRAGRLTTEWLDTEDVLAIPYDTPVPGYRNDTVNTLRLWSARATEEFDLRYFNEGDYLRAVEEKAESENITKVLYPNDNVSAGRELRLQAGVLLRVAPRCRTSSAATRSTTAVRRPEGPAAPSTASPSARRSSSTTRTPRSRSPS